MAKVKASELVSFCKSKLGTPYVYGAKGEVLTQALLNTLASLYPSTFTSSYIKKAQAFIGQNCVDCSGLISWITGIERSSSGFKSTAVDCVGIGAINDTMIGWGLWKSGHIGVYIGNGYCIEARGIDYGTVQTKVSERSFTYVIKLCDIDYAEQTAYVEGWIPAADGKRWWYQFADGSYAANGWYELEEKTGGTTGYYLFDADGYMLTGLQQDAAGDYYYMSEFNDNTLGQNLVTDERGVLVVPKGYDHENHRYILD